MIETSWALKAHLIKASLIRKTAEAFGIQRYSRPALNDLDAKLAARLPESGFFIEAGAHDGFTQSNTYRLERWEGWRGILIEPIPALAAKCKNERPGSKVYQCALAASQETRTIAMRYAGLMSLVAGSKGEAERAFIQEGLEKQGLLRTYEITVPVRTLTEILSESHVPQIDFLSLDLEGFEDQALLGLDLALFRPEAILVETKDRTKIDQILRGHYAEPEALTHHDYFYRKLS
jgi:FkbM family methyltransferase